MCGASDSQKHIEQAQENFYNVLTSEHQQEFAQFQQITNFLNQQFEPILAKGPNQEGFSDEEKTALESQATEKVGADFQKAQRAVQQKFQTGDGTAVNGQEEQVMGEVASAGAKESSDLNLKITQDDYATGRQNYLAAASELSGVAGIENPVGMANAATGAGSAASKTASDIASEGNAWMGPVFSAVGGILGGALGEGGILNSSGSGGSEED